MLRKLLLAAAIAVLALAPLPLLADGIINGGGGGGSPTGAAGGSLTGTYPNPGLNLAGTNTGVLPTANGGVDQAAWSAFTPALTCGTATFTTNSAKFKLISPKTTAWVIDTLIATIGTCTTNLTFTAPNTSSSAASAAGREIDIAGFGFFCAHAAATANFACKPEGATVFAVNDHLVITGIYENQ